MTQVSQKQTLKFPVRCSVCIPELGRSRTLGLTRSTSTALSASQPSGGFPHPRGVAADTTRLKGTVQDWRVQRRAKGRNARQDGQCGKGGGKAEPPRGQGSPHLRRNRGPPTFPEGHRVGDAARGTGPRHLGRRTSKWQPRGSGRPAGDGAGEGGERDIFGHSLARHGAEEAPPRSRKRGSRVTRAL